MTNTEIVYTLNELLAQEHACALRYATHASVVEGPYAETVSARLKEIAGDEILHAQILRDRIVSLGGTPTMDVHKPDLVLAKKLEDILKFNINEEKQVIEKYSELLRQIPPTNAILFEAIQDITKDEQEHLEELQVLQPAREAA